MIALDKPLDLWFHGVNNTKWDITSYKKILSIKNVVELTTTLKNIDYKIFPNAMFFLMLNNVKPIWEDPINKDGGTWSFKIEDNKIKEIWYKINMLFVTENIFNNNVPVFGISVAPKKGYYILKIWTGINAEKSDFSLKLEELGNEFNKGVAKYKAHVS